MKQSLVDRLFYTSLVGGLALFVLIPVGILLTYSFTGQWNYPDLLPTRLTTRWYSYLFQYEGGLKALILSIQLAIATTVGTIVLGTPAGYVLARYRFRGRTALEMLLMAKTVVPSILIAVGLASLYFRWQLYDTFYGVLLAHLVGGIPFMVWTCSATFGGIGKSLEEAARDMGAGFWRTFFEILLPLALPGVMSGSILVFLYSMQEFPITLLISGLNITTMPLALYDTLQRGSIEPASASAVVLLLPSVVYLLIAVKFLRLSDISAGLGRA